MGVERIHGDLNKCCSLKDWKFDGVKNKTKIVEKCFKRLSY